jgi:hypothetical protein
MEVSVRTKPLLLMVSLFSNACFQFVPVNESAPLPEAGTEVRVQLESPQALDLGTMTLSDVASVQGHVRQSQGDALSLFSSDLRTAYGFRQRTNGAVFEFDRSQFRTLERRELAPLKTGIAAGTALIGMAAFWYFASDLAGGGDTGNPTPPSPGVSRVVAFPFNVVLPLLFP